MFGSFCYCGLKLMHALKLMHELMLMNDLKLMNWGSIHARLVSAHICFRPEQIEALAKI